MNIILFGPPGSGKGTQADNIVKNFNLHKVSTGDLLRNEVKKHTLLGKEIKPLIDKGSFVSDKIIDELINKTLINKDHHNKLIFDGYPRNLSQAKDLEILSKKYNQKISCVLNLKVEKNIVIKRILGRQVCSKCGLIFNEFFKPSTKLNHSCDTAFLTKRSDDNKKIIEKRFDTYNDKTFPILDFYNNMNLLHEINGMAKIDDIYKEIHSIIAPLHT